MKKTSYMFNLMAMLLLLLMGSVALHASPGNGKIQPRPTGDYLIGNDYRAVSLTVGNGTATNSYSPVYGYYFDAAQRSQVIYNQSLLVSLQGQQIQKVKFHTYTANVTAWNGTVTVSICTTATADLSAGFITGNFSNVYQGVLSVSNNIMEINFTTPFTYTGGNLVIQFDQPVAATYSRCEFYGITATNTSRMAYGSNYSTNGTIYNFLPKTTFETPTTCPIPTDFALTNAMPNSASFSWNAGGTETAWELEYGAPGFTQGTGTTVSANADSATLTGLTPETNYQVYLRAVCGVGDESFWIGPIAFSTPQIPGVVPYLADFEDSTENANWGFARNISLTYPNNWYIDTAESYTGLKSLYISNNSGVSNAYTTASATCAVWAYRDVYLTPAAEYELKFDWKAIGQTTVDYMRVYVGTPTSVAATTSTTVVAPTGSLSLTNPLNNSYYFNAYDGTNNTFTGWNQFTQIFPGSSLAGTTQRIYFVWVNNSTNGAQPPIAIDNISVIGRNCTGVSNINVTGISSTEGTLYWTPGNNESVFEIVYSSQAGVHPDSLVPVTVNNDTNVLLSGLSPVTTYYVQIRALCGIETSAWSPIFSFTTGQNPATLPYSCDFENATERGNWQFANSTSQNKWYVGTAANFTPGGSYSVFISDNGTVATYTSSLTTVWAYRDIYFDVPGDYEISFDWKCEGESSWDFMSIFVGDIVSVTGTATSTRPIPPPTGSNAITLSPTPTTNSSYPTYFNLGDTNLQHYQGTLPQSYSGTTKRLYFGWTNDGIGHYPPSAIFDNVEIDVNPCLSVDSVSIPDSTITPTTAVVHWTSNNPLDTNWILEYKLAADTNWTTLPVTSNPYTLTGLLAASDYNFRMKTDCGGGSESYYTSVLSFITDCDVVRVFPWNYNFEDPWYTLTSHTSPRCWNNMDQNNASYYWQRSTSSGINSTGCAYFYGSSTSTTPNNDYLITPYIDLTGNEQLRFYVKNYSTSYTPKLTIVGLAAQTSTIGSTIRTITVNHNTYQEYTINLSAFQGEYCIAFARRDSGQYHLYLDNVVIEPIPACVKPTAVTITALGSDSALVAWTAGAGTTDFEIAMDTSATFDPDSVAPIVVNGATQYTFNGLQPTTTYYFYVRADCGGNYSDWTLVSSFTTTQIPAALPYICDFENATENANWQYVNLANMWIVGTATYNSPSHSLYVSNDGVNQGYGNNSSSIWAYRDISFPVGNQFTLSFDWKGVGETTWDYMKVYIGDAVDVSSTLVANGPTGSTNLGGVLSAQPNWTNYNIILDSTYSGTIKRIYFGWREDYSGSNGLPAAVDNLMIEVLTCPPVTAVMVPPATITEDSAVVNWTAGGTETAWIVEYKMTTDAQWTIINVTTDTFCILSGLQPSTTYQVRVKANCGVGDESMYSTSVSFTTDCASSITALPWTYDFPGTWPSIGTRTAPLCWNNTDNGSSTYTYWRYNSTYGIGGSGCAYYYGYSSTTTLNNAWLITPPISLSGNEQVVFYAKNYSASYSPVISIYVLTDQNDTTSSTRVANFTVNTNNYTEYVADLSAYTGVYAIAFVRIDQGNEGMYVDNISVEPIPTCIKPSLLVASNIGSTDATISWTAGEANPAGYEISYSTDPAFNPDTASLRFSIGDTNRYTFPVGTLSPTTTYYLYVRTLCGGNDTSVWNNTVLTITTNQLPATLPYICDFENQAEVMNWQVANSTNPAQWYVGTAQNNTPGGSYSAYISSNGGTAATYTTSSVTVWAYRDISFDVQGEYIMSFDWKGEGESSWDFMRVFIGDRAPVLGTTTNQRPIPVPTGSNASILTPVPVTNSSYPTYFNLADTSWQSYSGTLPPAYYNTIKRIYFAWTNDGSGTYEPSAVVDNILIDVNPCFSTTNLVIPDTSVTSNSATVHWTAGGPDTTWILEYKPADNQTWNIVAVNGTPTYQFTGLNSGTTYQVRVRTNCGGGDTSFYSPIVSFATSQIPVVVPFVCDFEDANENANWQFANNLSATANNWYISNAINNGGDSCLYISDNGGLSNNYSNNSCVVWAYRDVYFTPAGEYTLTFDWKCYGYSTSDYMLVFVGNPTTVTASTATTTYTAPAGAVALLNELRTSYQTYFNGYDGSGYNNTTWNTYSSLLDGSYSGTTKRIYFAWINNSYSSNQGPAAVDNISIAPVACARPMNLSIVHVDTTNITLNWVPASDETDFEIVISTDPQFIIDTCTNRFFVSDTVITISSLLPNTAYYIYIRANCGQTTNSSWSSIFPFMTTQVPLVVPFVCDFEDSTEVTRWGIANNTNASYPNAWYIDSAANNGGSVGLYVSADGGVSNSYASNACMIWAYRDIYFATQGDYELSFDWRCYGESSFDYMVVFMGDPSAVSAATTNTVVAPPGADTIFNSLTGLIRYNGYNPSSSSYPYTSWNTQIQNLYNYYGQTKRIYFGWRNDGSVINSPSAAVDNIIVNANSCLSVTDVTIPDSTISTDSAVIYWTSRGDETSWIIEYKLTTSNTWIVLPVSTNPYTLTGLQHSSSYNIRVKADCGGGSESFYSDVITINTLCGQITTLPWMYTFEDTWVSAGNRTAPSCWNNIDNASSYYWRSNAMSGMGGSGCAYFYGTTSTSTTYDASLITPEVVLTGNEQIVFFAKNYNASYTPVVSIYVLTDQNDMSTATLVTSFQVSNNNYQEFVADLSAYTGNYYVALVRRDNGNSGVYIDNVIIEPIPSCVKPSSVTITNSGDTYATIEWTSTEVSPLGYEIAISTDPNFDPDTCTFIFGTGDTNSFTLPVGTLQPSSTYYVFIRTVCSASDTSIWNYFMASFGTAQIPLQVPFVVDFEDLTENSKWQFVNRTNQWIIDTATYNSPTHSLYVSGDGHSYGQYNNSGSSIWAYRDVVFPQGDQFTISFDWKCVGEASSYDYLKVYIGDIQDVTDVLVATGPTGASGLGGTLLAQPNWTTYTGTLPGTYSGLTKRIYVGWREDASGTDGDPAAFDNLTIIVNCPEPTAIYVLNVDDTSAELSWVSTETNFNIEYGPDGFTQGTGTMIPVTGTTYTLTGLTPDTDYDVYVQADCGDGNTSDWLPYGFTTTATSINDLNLNQQVQLFPNPANEFLQIESSILFDYVEVYNYLGQTMIEGQPGDSNFVIEVKNYAPGVYFVKLIGNEGTVVKKFVKE